MAGWSSAAGRFIPLFFTRSPHAYERLETMELNPHSDPSSSKIDVEAIETANTEQVAGPEHAVPTGRRDKAAELLDSVPTRIALTAADNRRLLRKIDLVILPILLTVYFLQALDKATLAYASVFGLITDTNLQGEEYSWLGSIVYVAQLVFQPLVAFLLVKLPIGKFTGVVVLGWGIVLCCMAIAHNFSGLLATRFFLGAMEASVGEHHSTLEMKFARC
jgi:Major Facilitator Superfamily